MIMQVITAVGTRTNHIQNIFCQPDPQTSAYYYALKRAFHH